MKSCPPQHILKYDLTPQWLWHVPAADRKWYPFPVRGGGGVGQHARHKKHAKKETIQKHLKSAALAGISLQRGSGDIQGNKRKKQANFVNTNQGIRAVKKGHTYIHLIGGSSGYGEKAAEIMGEMRKREQTQ